MTINQPSVTSDKRKLTAQNFVDIITQKDKAKWDEFYGEYFHYKYDLAIIIKDVEVEEDIELDNSLVVELPVVFMESIFHNFQINSVEFKENINIEGGDFNGDFCIDGGVFQKGVSIGDGKFKKEFIIRDGDFRGDFEIGYGEFTNGIVIEGGKFQENFEIFNGKFFGGFRIDDAEFQKNFIIEGGKFYKSFTIFSGRFCEDFVVSGGYFARSLEFLGGEFKLIDGHFASVNYLLISHLTPKTELYLKSQFIVNRIVVDTIIPKDSLVKLENEAYDLVFKNVQNFGQMVLIDFSFKNDWENMTAHQNYRSSGSPPLLTIKNSDLGKTTLINSDLSGFDLDFKSSKITDVFLTGTKMPRQITTKDEDDQPDYRQHQLGYSQIKKIYEARGDRIEANRYYALEMEAYRNTLSKGLNSEFWERVNLGLNRLSTNYGQSWERGLASTLLVGLVFYLAYCSFLHYYPALPNKNTLVNFGYAASYFLEFLNPIHKADYISDQLLAKGGNVAEWSLGCARGVEGVSRIFIAYFVYQLIQAFRKHGKSGG